MPAIFAAPPLNPPSPSVWPEQLVMCSDCGSETEVSRVRLRAKGPTTWQCNRCNSKTVQLTRMFGSWPPPQFEGIPQTDLQAFFADNYGKNPRGTRAAFDAKLSHYHTAEESFAFNGEFLPLGVWRTRGFDADRTFLLDACAIMSIYEHSACCGIPLVAVFVQLNKFSAQGLGGGHIVSTYR